jgi:hypothetical protein
MAVVGKILSRNALRQARFRRTPAGRAAAFRHWLARYAYRLLVAELYHATTWNSPFNSRGVKNCVLTDHNKFD